MKIAWQALPCRKIKNFSTLKLFLLLSSCLLSGCNQALLNPKGMIAIEQRQLLIVATLLMLLVVIPVFFMIFYFFYRYRASNKKNNYAPNWAYSFLLECIWWGIPIIIIVVLAIITWISSHSLDPYKPLTQKNKNTLIIQVVALDWKWLFIYPQQNIATVNYLQFPVNTPVQFDITSDAPMNSFMIPQLAGQIYAMSGMKTQLHLITSHKGIYSGLSANYSGVGFSSMHFHAKVTSTRAFNHWVQSIKQSHNPLTLSAYKQLSKPSGSFPISYFSVVTPNLFRFIIEKYTLPTQHEPASQEKPQKL